MGGGSGIGGIGAVLMDAVYGQSASPANPMTAPQTEDFFTYAESDVVVAVGQPVALLPMLPSSFGQFVFAVAPELPRGLTIDTRTGLVHGVPQEATSGKAMHFVTACEPCSATVKIAIIYLNIINIMAPGKHITNLVHHGSGLTTVTLHDAPSAPASPLLPANVLTNGIKEVSPQLQQVAQALVSQVQDQLMLTALRSASSGV
jgi:hypothetical protein